MTEEMGMPLALLASNLRRVRAVSPQDTSWVPALGEVADVSLNTLSACRGASNSKVAGVTQAWSGMAYAPWWGSLGSFIHAGGGHDDGEDNAIWRYDIALRTFTKIKDHAESFYIDGYNADETTGWMWADTGGVNLQEGEPFTSHFYAYLIAIPPEALAGAPDGWLFTPGRGAMPDGGQRGTTQAHKWALGTSELWTMHGDPVPRRPGHGCTLYDTSRNRVITLAESQESATTSHVFFDFDTGESGDYTTLSGVRGHYMIGAYHQAADCYMGIRHATSGGVNTLTFKVITASTGAVTTPTPAGTPPSELSEGAWDWIEAWNAWVYYPGNGSNNIYTLTCDGDPRSGTWTWDVQSVTGTVRAVTGAGGIPYNRLRACQQLTTAEEAVLLWVSKYDAPAQAIKISR